MAHVITGTDAYPLPTTTVPDGGDPATATAGGPAPIDVPLQAHEDKIATALGRIGGTTGTAEWNYPVVRARTVFLPLMSARPGRYYVDDVSDAATLLTAAQAQGSGWGPIALVTVGAHPPRDTVAEQFTWRCGITYQNITLDVRLAQGVIVTRIDCAVVCAAADADASQRIIFHFFKRNVAGAVTDLGSAAAPNAAGPQTISLVLGAAETLDTQNFTYHVVLRSSGDNGVTDDEWHSCEIVCEEPGPAHL
jgi:hypothetical protein